MVSADRDAVVCERCELADRAVARLRGLLGRSELPPGDGMLLRPSGSIHTAFMRFAIDAVFLDADLQVLQVRSELRPWRAAGARRARGVLELAAGQIAERGVAPGERLRLVPADGRGAGAAGAAERALVRFGFDLHDGPAQGIAALQAEIRSLEGQVSEAFARDPRAALLLGRLGDLESRSATVADQIRALARSAGAPAGIEEPVEEVLRGELRQLRAATGIEAELELSGPVDAATPSQRIALLRGIQEALRNVREHSRARHVRLRVAAGEDRIEAEVRDDGCGFDAERVRAQAPLAGHLGLVGIVERARLLGGDCEVRSADGGPTSIRISLPRWEPDQR